MRRAADVLTPRVHLLVDTLGVGGAEVLLTQYARLGDVDISVACLKDAGAGHVAERLRACGIEPRCVGIPGHLGPSAFLRVRRHLADMRPALVHTHLSYADLLGGPAARSLGIPTVATLHSYAPPSTPRERVRALMTDIARRSAAARVIAVSRSARDAYLATGGNPQRVVVLHNGIGERPRPGSGAGMRRELGLAPDDLVVAMLSSLRPEKAHDVAIGAIALLLPRFSKLRLLLLGDGPLLAQIERAAAPLGDRAVLAGYRPDAMAALDAADLLLHPSRRDTLPTAILEAMACSLPVVATDVGGIGELVVDGETGSLVAPPPDAGRVAEGLAPLLDDPCLRRRMGSAGRARFEAEFSVDRWARLMRDLYLSVLDGAR